MPTLFKDHVVFGDVVFNDPLQRPAVAGIVEWGCDILAGWDDTMDIDDVFVPRGATDGAVSADFFAGLAKQMIASGYVVAATRAIADQLWDVIVRDAFPRNKTFSVVRYEPIPKRRDVKLSGRRTREWTGPLAFRWGAEITAEDPFKYSLASESGSAGVSGQPIGGRSYPRMYPLQYTTILSGTDQQVVITNSGTSDSHKWTAVIVGPLLTGGWRLVNETTDEFIKFDVALSASDVLAIDFERGIGTLNGIPVTASLSGDFFALATGVNVLKLYGDYDPAAGFTVDAYSAWE